MISRIRLDAYGKSARAVEDTLRSCADDIDGIAKKSVLRGEQVIERNLSEADDGHYAFKGRLLLYPDQAKTLTQYTANRDGTIGVEGQSQEKRPGC